MGRNNVPLPPDDFGYKLWKKGKKFYVKAKFQKYGVEVNEETRKLFRSTEKASRRIRKKDAVNGLSFVGNMDTFF